MPLIKAAKRNSKAQATLRKLLLGIHRLHEDIVAGKPLTTILDEIVDLIDECIPHTRGSFMLIDEDGKHLRVTSHGRMPRAYCEAIDHLLVAQGNGVCGTAAFRRELVIVSDTFKDPLFKDFKHLAEKYDILSCWSSPILSSPVAGKDASDRRVLGTFAIYGSVTRKPTKVEVDVVQKLANLTAIAIERDQFLKHNENTNTGSLSAKELDELRKRLEKLSARQREVLNLVAKGIATKVIARDLKISEKTVSQHRSTILSKMKADNTPALVRILAQLGELK